MKKYLFIVLLVGVWGCDDKNEQPYLNLEWFYWCGRFESDGNCSQCEIYKINDIDTSGTILGERGVITNYTINREYIRWFEDENLLIFKNYEQDEDSVDVQAYIDARSDSLVCFWFSEK